MLAEKVLGNIGEGIRGNATDSTIPYPARWIDHVGGRNLGHASVRPEKSRSSPNDWVVDADPVAKGADVFRRAVLGGHPDDEKPVIAEALLKIDEVGNLHAAGAAPGRPKVEHDDLASMIGQPKRSSLQRPTRKIGGSRSGVALRQSRNTLGPTA